MLSRCGCFINSKHQLNWHQRMQVTLAGHRGAVTALRYNRAGALLASGAQDTDVIVWDVVAEAGLFRLRAHTGQVTDLVPPWHGCNYLYACLKFICCGSAAHTYITAPRVVSTTSAVLCSLHAGSHL